MLPGPQVGHEAICTCRPLSSTVQPFKLAASHVPSHKKICGRGQNGSKPPRKTRLEPRPDFRRGIGSSCSHLPRPQPALHGWWSGRRELGHLPRRLQDHGPASRSVHNACTRGPTCVRNACTRGSSCVDPSVQHAFEQIVWLIYIHTHPNSLTRNRQQQSDTCARLDHFGKKRKAAGGNPCARYTCNRVANSMIAETRTAKAGVAKSGIAQVRASKSGTAKPEMTENR
mmetsp:Transcript_20630/g.61543  ORF Transcript_20630/g.61543 Transcript_20630/m.61543 type:complete len:228 (+) Transcript_20630:75-758(+)